MLLRIIVLCIDVVNTEGLATAMLGILNLGPKFLTRFSKKVCLRADRSVKLGMYLKHSKNVLKWVSMGDDVRVAVMTSL